MHLPRKKQQRVRRTYGQLFLDKLESLAPGGQKLIKNKTLREALDWDEERYKRIRRELADQKRIVIGRGRGGLVGLAQSPGSKGLTVFISYSHSDESFKNDLLKHLEPLHRLGLIESMWQQTPFAKLQALPRDARAVSLWQDRDEALVNVSEGIRRVAEELLETE